MNHTKIKGGICAPKGFRSAAVSCGIKQKNSDKLDLTLIYSKHPTVGAAVFTKNKVKKEDDFQTYSFTSRITIQF